MENDAITSEEMEDFFEFEKKTPVKKQRNPSRPSVDYKTMSAIELLERVLNVSEDSKLDDRLFSDNEKLFDEVVNRLKISPVQAVFLSVILNKNSCAERDLGRHLECSRLTLLSKQKSLDELVERSIIEKSEDFGGGIDFEVKGEVIDAILNNKPLPESTLVTSDEDFFIKLSEIMSCFHNERGRMSRRKSKLIQKFFSFMEKNVKINFAKRIVELEKAGVHDLPFLVHFCDALVMRNHREISDQFIEQFYGSALEARDTLLSLHKGKHDLFQIGYIEFCTEGVVQYSDKYQLTQKAKDELGLTPLLLTDFAEISSDFNLTKSAEISAKELYYSADVTRKVEDLSSILKEDKYQQIMNNLKQRNMRPGLPCLFYGHPGTGKTETILQLARLTGRDIMQVNVTQIQDKFVGESEKNIKHVFDEYRRLVKAMPVAPILLFNEADAIIGKRVNVNRSVDQMNNAVQNIILQELENLEGVFVATTNLTENLDPAFERRFIYKIQFDRPDASVRHHIWKALIPELDDDTVRFLAQRYDYSGGQIENIARKLFIDNVLWNTNISKELLERFCDEECLSKPGKNTIKGFCA